MFTGLIETLAEIRAVTGRGSGIRLSVVPLIPYEVKIGDSVSVNGICLTVVAQHKGIDFDVSPETLEKSSLKSLRVKDKVNLERALRLDDRLGGHIVTGHVDGVGYIREIKSQGGYTFLTIRAPEDTVRYVVRKGSVAVDGISLTVNSVKAEVFDVAVIPYTLKVTNLVYKKVSEPVNIETDIIGKYVAKFLERDKEASLWHTLNEKGFL
jgi:riboflavin synthase